MNPTLRFLARAIAQAALAGALAAAPQDAVAQRGRPNVVLIVGEDHNAQVFGAYGDPKAQTPNLDRLAAGGTLFTRAYAASPGDGPSMQSLLTGRLPHSIGATGLYTPLGRSVVTLAHVFKREFYQTAAFGNPRFYTELDHGFDELTTWEKLQEELRGDAAGVVLPPPIPAGAPIATVWDPYRDPPRLWLNADKLPLGLRAEDVSDMRIAHAAADFISSNSGGRFFLAVVLHPPHPPFAFPIEYRDLFDPEDFEPPPLGPGDEAELRKDFRGLSLADKRGVMAAYYTAVAFMDACAGVVLDRLQAEGLERETLVVYLSDNGFLLGHHGRFEKYTLLEPAVRVPLVIRWPGAVPAGRSIDALVETVDVFATLAEIAGVRVGPPFEGRSLWPLLSGERTGLRERVFSEYLENEEAMIRDERYKLIYASGKARRSDGYRPSEIRKGRRARLYDLQADPGEFRDLADDPAHAERVQAMLRAMLERFRESKPDGLALPGDRALEDELDRFLTPRERWPSPMAVMTVPPPPRPSAPTEDPPDRRPR